MMPDLGRTFTAAGNGYLLVVALAAAVALWRRGRLMLEQERPRGAMMYRLTAALVGLLGFARPALFQTNFIRQAAGLEPLYADAVRNIAGVVFIAGASVTTVLVGYAIGATTTAQWRMLGAAAVATYAAWFALPFAL